MASHKSNSSSGGQPEPPSIRDDQNIAHSPASPDRSIGESSDHLAIAGNEPDVVDPLILTSGVITPELDALEAVLANDADEISALLNLPFSSLLARVQDLGFDADLLLEELRALGLIRADLWLTPVQLDQAEFLALTPLQYSELFPESGAPLVFAVLNAIRLSDEQAQLLATAGGTNLSKSETIGIVGAGIVGLYLLPKAAVHYVQKRNLVEKAEAHPGFKEQLEKGFYYDETTLKLTKREIAGIAYNSLDVKFDSWGRRFINELRSTLPGILVTLKGLNKSRAEAVVQGDLHADVRRDSLITISDDSTEFLEDHDFDPRVDYQMALRTLNRLEEEPAREISRLSNILSDDASKINSFLSENPNLLERSADMLEQSVATDIVDQVGVSIEFGDAFEDKLEIEYVHALENEAEKRFSEAANVITEEVVGFGESIEKGVDKEVANQMEDFEIGVDKRVSAIDDLD